MSKRTESSRINSREANLRDASQLKFLGAVWERGGIGGGRGRCDCRSALVRKLAAQKAGTKVWSELTFLAPVMQFKAGN